jgi:NADH:ubiquinone oxidoreductase subunit 5 (subunit L)/multisubunit Na+/H+ antiporter MnhA subunit
VVVAWGLPPWQADASLLGGHQGALKASEPARPLHELEGARARVAVTAQVPALAAEAASVARVAEEAHEWHLLAEVLAFLTAGMGVGFAALFYYYRVLDPAEAKAQFPALHRLLSNKWYFDDLYSAALVRPALVVARWCRAFDLRFIDRAVDASARATIRISKWDGRFDLGIIDGLVNLTARVIYAVGDRLRAVQTGYLRSYVLFLVLAAIGIFAALTYFVSLAAAK